jgi:cytoskeletal protein CcmA (bactofilin family)
MALPDLTTQTVNSTYQRLLQVGEGGHMFDGTGSLFIPLSASHEITHEVSSSHASTASMADRHNPDNPVFGKGYALIKHGTTLSGGTAALYLGTTHTGMDIVRLSDSSLVLGGVTQNYGWRIFGIKHGYHDYGSGFVYTTEIDNLIATGSMKVSGSIEINLQSGSAFTVIETDSDQQGRLDFAYTNGDPTLEIGSRSSVGHLHLRQGFTGTGFKLGSDGSIQINGSNAFRMQPTYFQPDTTNASTLGAFNRRWKDTFLYSGAKLGWSANTSADLVALQHVAATNTLHVTGSSNVTLDIKGNTVITGSLDVSGSITAEEDIELHYPKSLKWRGANGLSYNSIDSDDVSGYYAIRYTSNGGDGDANEMHEFYTNKGNVNNTRVSYITRGGDFHVTGSITSENTGSFKHIELGKSGTLNGTIKFNTLHGPNFGFEANNNSLVVTGTTGAPEQGFALDSQVENFSLYDGGTILVQKALLQEVKKVADYMFKLKDSINPMAEKVFILQIR